MALSSSCKEFAISKSGILSAKCKIRDTSNFSSSSLKLDEHIGFVDGKLTWGSHGFSAAAESLSVNAEGILTAKSKGNSNKSLESKLDLNRHIKNADGVLEIITRPLSLSSYVFSLLQCPIKLWSLIIHIPVRNDLSLSKW